jgi:hypothetical protein
VRRRARPFAVFGPGDYPGPHRIPFNVTDRVPQVCFIQHTSLESPLPKMPRLNVARVEIKRECAVDPLKGAAQCTFRFRHRNMVDVVIHQTVRPDSNLLGSAILGEQFKIDPSVCVVDKDDRFPIAALCQMI